MARNPPDERLVYLALKNHFRGADAQIRRLKKIREIIQKHQNHVDIRDLVKEHNIDDVCNMAKVLLEQQIFESTLKAKIRFPEVFEVSPAQSAEREASEAEAAKTEENALKNATEGRQSGSAMEEEVELERLDKGKGRALPSIHHSQKRPFPHTTISVPSLFPVYLPYDVQHQLLVKVQGLLERACYDFGKKVLGHVLAEEEWDCPESVELNRWPRVLLSHQDKFSTDAIVELGKPLVEVLDSISQLRHTAVHRLRVSVTRVEQFMVDSKSLARLLRDDSCSRTLSRLRRETQLTTDELKRNKHLLESTLAETFRKIAAQRAELEQLERIAVEDMLREDREYQSLIGTNLQQAIMSPEKIIQRIATTDYEPTSETDVGADSFDGQDIGQIDTHTSWPEELYTTDDLKTTYYMNVGARIIYMLLSPISFSDTDTIECRVFPAGE